MPHSSWMRFRTNCATFWLIGLPPLGRSGQRPGTGANLPLAYPSARTHDLFCQPWDSGRRAVGAATGAGPQAHPSAFLNSCNSVSSLSLNGGATGRADGTDDADDPGNAVTNKRS